MDKWQHALPLSEFLRPSELADLTLSDTEIARLQKMINTQNVSNMIFYGPPGLGKTSAARIITKQIDADILTFDGSDETSAGSLQRYLPEFVRSISLFGQKKVVLIDEGEYMSRKDQLMLRSVVENAYQNCRFIITTNNLARIDRAVQSRMVAINFDIHSSLTRSVMVRIANRLGEKLTVRGIEYDKDELMKTVMLYFPDFRQTVNRLEFQFG